MIVTRVNPLSLAKVSGIMYAILGLVTGAVFALVSHGGVGRKPGGAVFDMVFGVGAVLFMPIGYGIAGFLFSLIAAALYNGVARVVGGVEIRTDQDR